MAEKAGDLIKDALIEITLLGAEAPVEAVDAQGAIRYLNRMMTALNARGVDLGYTEVTNLGDDITIPAGANEGVLFLLARTLWNQYSEDGTPVPALLVANADAGLDTLLHIAVNVGPTEYPDTLPVGSGNENDSHTTSHFYADLQSTILAEVGGSVGLEDDTP